MIKFTSLLTAAMLLGCNGSPAVPSPDLASPFGTDVGSTIMNIMIGGTQRDANKNGSAADDPVATVSLSDYASDKSLGFLVVMVAAEWCVPCQNEQPEATADFTKFNKQGVAFLEAITQDIMMNPADAATVARWVQRFNVPFDMTSDTTSALLPYSNPKLFPSQMVIRLRDMSIQWKHDGYEKGTLESAITAALASP